MKCPNFVVLDSLFILYSLMSVVDDKNNKCCLNNKAETDNCLHRSGFLEENGQQTGNAFES